MTTVAVNDTATTAAGEARRLRLGFNSRIAFPAGHAAEGLRDGIELFRVAEQLGYDTGWVYQRHFDNYLASPLVFHAAVAQHTERIGLGTAIIGARYEDPVLLAEAAGTADLLSGGRLQLGLGTGQGGYDHIFGQEPNDGRDQSQARLATFLRGIRGEKLGEVTDPAGLVAAGTGLFVRPTSPTLPDRVWYGGGSVASAERVGRQGLRLLLSTILHGQIDDYGAELARAVEAYRAAYTGTSPSRVAIARSVLPATSPELARGYAAYDDRAPRRPVRRRRPAARRPEPGGQRRAHRVPAARLRAARQPAPARGHRRNRRPPPRLGAGDAVVIGGRRPGGWLSTGRTCWPAAGAGVGRRRSSSSSLRTSRRSAERRSRSVARRTHDPARRR
ncbi:LLM class flavin-dependent oxidoreductase [Parafrankia soli]|uniref:LLM class flavin-dependent oxidoreductase n=1 Tax=Parafrankia soli TaxID=2599596 RepID=UPI0012FF9C1B|nr:LLM class flavin-dependent oxidoreductase [Parafrankia soli]